MGKLLITGRICIPKVNDEKEMAEIAQFIATHEKRLDVEEVKLLIQIETTSGFATLQQILTVGKGRVVAAAFGG